ncbi:MAG: DNA-processing protein DprA, partial [Candidatus Pacebacteria bacterium]|nr:DNA-processing protein DprA [Candidatus Paceibacterota bacterium]
SITSYLDEKQILLKDFVIKEGELATIKDKLSGPFHRRYKETLSKITIESTAAAINKIMKENKSSNLIKIEKKDFIKYNFLSPLLHISDCPKHLYVRGNIPNKNEKTKVIAIIGTRSPTRYGKEVTEYLIRGLAGEDIIIISGLAIGIDTLSHREAINNNLLTVAFPGSGVNSDVLYPQSNKKFAEEILQRDGAIISEFEPNSKSRLYTFPARNRILAGIADLVLIIEAKEKSGTQITARLALDYNKDVAIVPGSIFSEYSKGTFNL